MKLYRAAHRQQRSRSALPHVAVAVLAMGTLLLSGCAKKPAAAPYGAAGGAGGGAALPVSVVTVQPQDVALGSEWVGTLDGLVNAQIQPQVSGYLVRQNYREGSVVSKGQVLFQIDPRPFQALLDQANGQIAQAEGQLGQAQADLGLRQINVKRDTPLAEQRAIAQSQLDNDKQQEAQAEATVASAKASIATAQANAKTAALNLGFTQVRSLISGVAGQATVQVGNLVGQSSVLTAVSQLDPIKVYFSIGDSEYLALSKRANAGKGDLLKGASKLPLTLHLADSTVYPHQGRIAFIDRQMNQQTGAIRIAATFPNPGNVLRPGQFGRVSANTEVLHNALLVPQAAVQDMQGLKQVYTVGPDNKAHLVTIQVGDQAGQNWVVTGGITPGTRVITDQAQKLKEGASVTPHAAAPDAPTSQVSDSAGTK